MKRDFSAGAYNEIVRLISKIESGPGSGITNWYGSGWYEYASWIDSLGIRTYISNVNSYHNTVVARNIAAKSNVDAVFNAVGDVDVAYGQVLANINANLSQWLEYTNQLAQIVNPRNDSFSSSSMSSSLDGLLVEIEQGNAQRREDMLVVAVGEEYIINEVLIEDFLNKLPTGMKDEEQICALLNMIQSTLIDAIPNIGLNGRVEIPIGVDMKLYYEVDANIDNGSNVDVKLAIEDQHLKFDGLGIKIANNGDVPTIGLEVSDEEIGFSADNENGSISAGLNPNDESIGFSINEGSGTLAVNIEGGGLALSNSFKNGNNTFTGKIVMAIDKIAVEESIETEMEHGSITSTMGIEKTRIEGDNNYNWEYMYSPQPMYQEAVVPNETYTLYDSFRATNLIVELMFEESWLGEAWDMIEGLFESQPSTNPNTGDDLGYIIDFIAPWLYE